MGSAVRVTSAAEGLPRRRFTVAEVEAMVAAGVMEEDERVELIGGELVPMSPKGNHHEVLKAALYASFCIRELWVIDAVRLTTRVFREPAADGYRNMQDLGPADRLAPLFASEAFALQLNELELS